MDYKTCFRDVYHRSRTQLSMCLWRRPTRVARNVLSSSASRRACRISHVKSADTAITRRLFLLITITTTMLPGGSPTPYTRVSISTLLRSISPFTWVGSFVLTYIWNFIEDLCIRETFIYL